MVHRGWQFALQTMLRLVPMRQGKQELESQGRLRELGYVDEDTLKRYLAKQVVENYGKPYVPREVRKPGRKLLGEILVEDGQITHSQLDEALAHQKKSGRRLGEILLQLGHTFEDVLSAAISKQEMAHWQKNTFGMEKQRP